MNINKKVVNKLSINKGITPNDIRVDLDLDNLSELSKQLAVIEPQLIKATDLITPQLESIQILSERIAEIYKPLRIFAGVEMKYLESIRLMQDKLLSTSLTSIGSIMKPLIESTNVFMSLISEQLSPVKLLEGLVIDLPLQNLAKTLQMSAKFSLDITAFERIRNTNEYRLEGQAVEMQPYKHFGVSASANFELRLGSIEQRLENQDGKIETILNYAENTDRVLLGLADYIRTTGSSKTKIKEVKYNRRETTITIDTKEVKITGNTKEATICQILLGNVKNLAKRWEMIDIVERLGEKFTEKNWNRIIYDKVRQINIKIAIETDIKDFFIATMATVEVNPKYIS